MQTPLVEMDGDEMNIMILVLSTEMRQMIRLPLMQQKQPKNTE